MLVGGGRTPGLPAGLGDAQALGLWLGDTLALPLAAVQGDGGGGAPGSWLSSATPSAVSPGQLRRPFRPSTTAPLSCRSQRPATGSLPLQQNPTVIAQATQLPKPLVMVVDSSCSPLPPQPPHSRKTAAPPLAWRPNLPVVYLSACLVWSQGEGGWSPGGPAAGKSLRGPDKDQPYVAHNLPAPQKGHTVKMPGASLALAAKLPPGQVRLLPSLEG